MAAYMILLRCIHRQAAGRSGNWKAGAPNFVGWGNWKARSPNFAGSPTHTVFSDRSSMSRGISSSAAAAPWLMLPPSLEDEGGKTTMCYNLYSPVDKKVTRVSNRRSSIGEEELIIRLESAEFVGSSHGWLALYKDWLNYALFLHNPISDRQIKLPPVESIPLADEKLKNCPEKLILSCPPEDSSNSSSSSKNNCRAILRYGQRCNMAVCCPGQSTEWTPFGAPFHEGEELNDLLGKPRIVRSYEDFVYSTRRKHLFCVTEYGDIEAWDIRDPLSPKLNWKKNDDDMDYDEENYPWHARFEEEDEFKQTCPTLKYLVYSEHSDQLFLVQRYLLEGGGPADYTERTVGFDVHEIIIRDARGGELRYMDGNLNGMAFFIGGEAQGSFVVEDPGAVNLLPDSIYYTDWIEVRTPSYWNQCGGHHLVIHNYAKETFATCHLPGYDVPPRLDMMDHEPVPSPLWFTPSSTHL